MNPRAAGSYAGEIKWLKEFMATRIAKLDQVFNYDPTISGIESVVTNSPAMNFRVTNGIISLDDATPFDVYSIDGVRLHSGCAPTRILPSGIYIVHTQGKTIKLYVK